MQHVNLKHANIPQQTDTHMHTGMREALARYTPTRTGVYASLTLPAQTCALCV